MASLLEIAASADGTVDQIETFLRENPGANLNPVDGNGRTPLSLAAKGGRNDLVSRLLRESAVLRNHRDKSGKTPLALAAETGQYQAASLLLGDKDVKFDVKDDNGCTPLWLAASTNNLSIIQLITERVTNALQTGTFGQTPLHGAAEHGHVEVVEWLLRQPGVQVDRLDASFRTPLLLALQNKHDSIVSLLIDKDTFSLSWLVREGDQMLAEALVFAGYNVDTEFGGKTPLSYALDRSNSAMVEFLLKCQASTKGITQEEWRRGLRPKVSQAVVISKYPSGLVKVDTVSLSMTSEWRCRYRVCSSDADRTAVKYVYVPSSMDVPPSTAN